MKSFWTKMSITKLVLLIIVVTLVIVELYKTFMGKELDQVFVDATIMIISFYYGQKGIKYEATDSLVREDLSEGNKI